ncbi:MULTISPECIES: hypothetical protein [unclassified Methanoculleus]|jgi:hypothetical protein|uniref:hypothetical protein n=1 Tax=unclassified Methanoculleus TaxID=2619537 RepID=UPI00319EA338
MVDECEAFEKIEAQVRALTRYTTVRSIPKGFSFERKYLLSCGDARRYLLRIASLSDPEVLPHKQAEFEAIRRFQRRFTFPHSCRNAVSMKSGNLTPTQVGNLIPTLTSVEVVVRVSITMGVHTLGVAHHQVAVQVSTTGPLRIKIDI